MPRRRGVALLDEWLLYDNGGEQSDRGIEEDDDWTLLAEIDETVISMSKCDAQWRQPPVKHDPVAKALKRAAARRESRRTRRTSAQDAPGYCNASVGEDPEVESEPAVNGEFSNDPGTAKPQPGDAESAWDPNDAGVMTSVMLMMLMNSKMHGAGHAR